jgi:hypothetical protein
LGTSRIPPTRPLVTAVRSPMRVAPPIADLRLATQPEDARLAESPMHLPRSASAETSAPDDATPTGGGPADLVDANHRPTPQKSSPEVEPLTASLRRLHLTVSREFLARVDRARDALSHSNLVQPPRRSSRPPSTSSSRSAESGRGSWSRRARSRRRPRPTSSLRT